VITAEATARELGSLSLRDALDLTALVAKKDRARTTDGGQVAPAMAR
jgi:hypothetical protein